MIDCSRVNILRPSLLRYTIINKIKFVFTSSLQARFIDTPFEKLAVRIRLAVHIKII